MDLPAEIRVLVYENISFPIAVNTLDTTQTLIGTQGLEAYQGNRSYDTRLILIRPLGPLEFLMTCQLIYKEARPIFEREMERLRNSTTSKNSCGLHFCLGNDRQ